MLLHINGEIVEIRPGELFESKIEINSRHLVQIHNKSITIKKKIKPKKKSIVTTFSKELNGSSTQS